MISDDFAKNRRSAARAIVTASVAAMLTAGCGELNLRKEIGLVGNGPDEFSVVSNDRLEMPQAMPGSPEQLPEPKPGAPSLVAPTPVKDAKVALNMQGVDSAGAASPSEQALLARANAENANGQIRDELAEDQKAGVGEARLLDGLFGNSDPALKDALDPEEEARRLALEAQKSKNPDLVVPPKPEEK